MSADRIALRTFLTVAAILVGGAHPTALLGQGFEAQRLPAQRFDSASAERRLKALYKVATLDAFGSFGRAELSACGALIDYVEATQKGRLPHLAPPRLHARDAMMANDAATRRNLELHSALDGGRAGSLLAVIDRTVTGAGARLLAARLAAPLTDDAEIRALYQ